MIYKASRNEHGHLVIRDVPIFVECSRGEMNFDAAWVDAAVKKAKQAEAEGYLPPLHVRHHENTPVGDPARPAGFFRVTKSAPLTFKGEPKLAIFADLIVTDPGVGEDVLRLRLPYRSVEILDVSDPAIDSLALLDHEAPYLQLPMLMVTDTTSRATGAPISPVALATFRNPWACDLPEPAEAVVACFRAGKAARLFIEDEDDMTFKKTPTPAAPADKKAKTARFEADDSGEGGEAEGGEDMAAEGEGWDVDAICAAIGDGSITVADMEKLAAAIAQRAAAQAPADGGDAGGMTALGPMPGGAMRKAAPGGDRTAFAALQARVDAQDAELQAMRKEAARKVAVDAALEKLAGRPLGADPAAKLAKRYDELGTEAFKVYVDDFAATFAAASRSGHAAAAFAGQGSGAPEVALAYTTQGAQAVEQATKFAAQHAELAKHRATRHTLEAFVASNMTRAGFKAAAK